MTHYTYMVTNKINGKVYVGSHSWKGEGIDPDYYGSGKIIKRAVEKYGKENFQVEVLYYYDTVEECRKDEERILTEYNVRDCPHSYNIKNAAVGWTSEDMKGENNPMYGKRGKDSHMYGKHLSDATRKKLSQAHIGKPLSDEIKQKLSQANNYRKTPVVAIDKNGKVKIFEGQRECSRVLGIHQGNINSCLKGGRKQTGGYIIKYLKRCSKDYKITKRKAKETEKIKLTTKIKGKTPIVAIQKDTGRVRMFLSQNECSRVLGVNQGSVSKCLLGKRNHTGGYTFKNINRDKRVFTVSPRSKADINTLRGIRKQTGGYTFKYLEQLESGIYEGIL